MSKKALLIIDAQIMPFVWKDYGGKQIYREEQLLNNIKGLSVKARRGSCPVIYIQFTERGSSMRDIGLPLWQIHPFIEPQENDISIIKYHADSFYQTELHTKLKERNVTELVITGVQTEYCVDTTCRAAFSLNYTCELVIDAHSTYDSELLSAAQIINHHNAILASQFAGLKDAADIQF